MSTPTAIHAATMFPPSVDSFVGTLAERTTKTAFSGGRTNTDRPAANQPSIATSAVEPNAGATPEWFFVRPVETKRRLGKSGAFALVAAAHVLVFIGLANLPQSVREQFTAPIQVVAIAESQQDTRDVPPPPKPQLQNFDVPVEPVFIDIAEPESMAITVRAQPQEAAASTPQVEIAAAPKTVSSVEYVREPVAKFPSAARAMKQHGTVILRVLIDANGRAREVSVHESSGYRLLDDAGRKAVLDGRYKPYMEDGRASPVYVLIPIEFPA